MNHIAQIFLDNPAAALFGAIGLVPGLLLDSAITLGAVAFLITTPRMSRGVKGAFFALVIATTGYAVFNNSQAIATLGISPLGIG